MFKAAFFEGTTFLGESDLPWQEWKEERGVPQNLLFYCEECNADILRMLVDGSRSWYHESRRCHKCGHRPGRIAGSIFWLPFGHFRPNVLDLQYLPRAVLLREFESHYDYYFNQGDVNEKRPEANPVAAARGPGPVQGTLGAVGGGA